MFSLRLGRQCIGLLANLSSFNPARSGKRADSNPRNQQLHITLKLTSKTTIANQPPCENGRFLVAIDTRNVWVREFDLCIYPNAILHISKNRVGFSEAGIETADGRTKSKATGPRDRHR